MMSHSVFHKKSFILFTNDVNHNKYVINRNKYWDFIDRTTRNSIFTIYQFLLDIFISENVILISVIIYTG